jgi:hypothetical protein
LLQSVSVEKKQSIKNRGVNKLITDAATTTLLALWLV